MTFNVNVSTLLLDDNVVDFNRAVLSIDSNACWRVEIDLVESDGLSHLTREDRLAFTMVSVITNSGYTIRGSVRLRNRFFFPERSGPVVLEGIQPLVETNFETMM